MHPHYTTLKKSELKYIADKFKTTIEIVKLLRKKVGKSRKKLYNAISEYLSKLDESGVGNSM